MPEQVSLLTLLTYTNDQPHSGRQQQGQEQYLRNPTTAAAHDPAPFSDSAQQFLPAPPTTLKRRHHDHTLRIPASAAMASS
ncbi:hypothetical protein BC938DRAFT_479980 [Jimgerdemannia flammicorona]|uniref:Uncharacterized protein n=1 Tax=Jimgerdemannia flammicorona TaxID=994334 RepID=A0A433QJN5_9FUNG|nr:hypothetical protein BC938DRAFT_479980 [Jimgerdemannia flammicorona]